MSNAALPPPILQAPARPPVMPGPKPARPPVRVARRPAPSLSAKEALFRVLVVLLLASSLGLVWWTYARVLAPLQKRSREMTSAMARLSAEVDAMERKWDKAGAEQLRAQYSQLPSRLITGQPELAAWVAHLQDLVVPLALDASPEFGQTVLQHTNDQKLAQIPTTISVAAQPARGIEGSEPAYQRLLRLSQSLVAQPRRADLTELTVVSGADSLSHAEIVLQLWAGEEEAP